MTTSQSSSSERASMIRQDLERPWDNPLAGKPRKCWMHSMDFQVSYRSQFRQSYAYPSSQRSIYRRGLTLSQWKARLALLTEKSALKINLSSGICWIHPNQSLQD